MLAGPEPRLLVKLPREAGSLGRSPSGQPRAQSPGFAQTVHLPTFCQTAPSLQGPSSILSPSLPFWWHTSSLASVISLISLGQHNTHISTRIGI